MNPIRRARARLYGLTAVMFFLLLLEVAGYLFLSIQQKRHPRLFYLDINEYLASFSDETLRVSIELARKGNFYLLDPKLGWIRRENSQLSFPNGTTISTDLLGSRRIPGGSGRAIISTFGNSFTEGLEVDDGEIWRHTSQDRRGGRCSTSEFLAMGPTKHCSAWKPGWAPGSERRL